MPSVPLVKPGDMVTRGEKIAEAAGLGANLHASVGGVVAAVDATAICIAADEEQQGGYTFINNNTDNVVDAIKEAGIVGMGGAGFPTHVKLGAELAGGVVIANAAECEPMLNHNIGQLLDEPELIYRGLRHAMQAIKAAKGIIAIKSKHTEAIKVLKSVIKDHDVTIAELPDLYPMGEERAIIREILGCLLAPEQLPSAANAVVCNVETLGRIADAVERRKPVISKHVTVSGRLKGGVLSRVFMDVPLGTRVGDLIEAAGGIDGEYGEIIMGGPFTGRNANPDDVITKTTGGVLVTMPFTREARKLGLLVCACGANEARLREIARRMGASVAGVERCKQVVETRGSLKCENPGNCPGQAEKILKLKKSGAEALLISNCSDCSNTVMGVAPKLKLPVYHHTDHALRSVNYPLVRKLKH